MTNDEIVKLNKDVIEAWNKHDVEKFQSLCDTNVVWKDTSTPDSYKGKKGAGEFFDLWNKAFPDFKLTIINTVVGDNSIAVEIEFSGTNTGTLKMGEMEIPATRKKVTANRGSYLAWFKNGKVTEVHTYPDLAGMMVQLGLMQEQHA